MEIVINIVLCLGFSCVFVVLGTGNLITGMIAVLCILMTILSTVGTLVLLGEKIHVRLIFDMFTRVHNVLVYFLTYDVLLYFRSCTCSVLCSVLVWQLTTAR